MIYETVQLDPAGEYTLIRRLLEPDGMPSSPKQAPVFLFVPGGGFASCFPSDQEAMLLRFMSYGYASFTFTYPVRGRYRFPDILIYLSKAIHMIRQHAAEWNIAPHKIVVAGCSAGAFIAGALGGLWNAAEIQNKAGCAAQENRPDVLMLCYGPLHTTQQTEQGLLYVPASRYVGSHTPPSYLMHAADDSIVPVEQSLAYAGALANVQVPFGMYITPTAGHFGLQYQTRKVSETGRLTSEMDDWFHSFLLFADNAFGTPPTPEKAPKMVPPPGVATKIVEEAPKIRPGSYAADLKMNFFGEMCPEAFVHTYDPTKPVAEQTHS